MSINLEIIADFDNKFHQIMVLRDQYGKWYVNVDGVRTQSKLNASEIVRYLANAANEE